MNNNLFLTQGNQWMITHSLNVVNPADNTIYQFWPRSNLGMFTVPLMMWTPPTDIMVTDFAISKNCNGVNGTAEPSTFNLIERRNVKGTDYTTLAISNRYKLMDGVLFSNTIEMTHKTNGLALSLYDCCMYAYEWITPVNWATNPTNIYIELTLNGIYL